MEQTRERAADRTRSDRKEEERAACDVRDCGVRGGDAQAAGKGVVAQLSPHQHCSPLITAGSMGPDGLRLIVAKRTAEGGAGGAEGRVPRVHSVLVTQ